MTKKKQQLLIDYLHDGIHGGEKNKLEKAMVAISAFMKGSDYRRVPLQAASASGMGTSTDFERVERQTMDLFIENDYFDNFWMAAFKEVTVAQGQDSWEIYNVENGITFRKVPEGDRIDVAGLKGTKETVYVDKYGGALGWTDEMIRFRKVPAMLDFMEMFRNKFFANKANNHYTLITAGFGGTTTYQGAATDTQASRDIATINQAAYEIGNAVKDKGYTMGQYVLYLPESMRSRITTAINISGKQVTIPGALADGSIMDTINYNVRPAFTFDSNLSGTTGYMVLPGNKIQRADVMQPTSYTDMDILSFQNVQAVWAYYGAAVGDTDQIRKVQFA